MVEANSGFTPCIKIVGIGGSGINVLNHIIESGMQDVDFIAVSLHAFLLKHSKAQTQILVGENRPQGLGVTQAPVYREIAEEARETLKKHLCGADMVFVIACMGGNTASGAASVVASCAREVGALTIAVATRPFAFEGARRRRTAEEGISTLRENVDTIVVISGDCVLSVLKKTTPLMEAFRVMDDTIRCCIQAFYDVFLIPRLTSVDYSDIKRLFSSSGVAKMGHAAAKGKDGAIHVANEISKHSLLEDAMESVEGIFLSIAGGEDVSLQDMSAIPKAFWGQVESDVNIVWGSRTDAKLANDEIRVTAIVLYAHRFDNADKAMPRISLPTNGAVGWLRKKPVEELIPRPDGKKVCKYLRDMRIELAQANNIPFESEECTSEAPCAGTCEQCDQESFYLHNELARIPTENRRYPHHIIEDWGKQHE